MGSEVTSKDRKTTRRQNWIVERTNDIRIEDFRAGDVFDERFPGDRGTVEIEMRRDRTKQCRQPARVVKIFHEIFAAGANVGQQGSFLGKRIEIVERNPDSSAAGESDQVNDC